MGQVLQGDSDDSIVSVAPCVLIMFNNDEAGFNEMRNRILWRSQVHTPGVWSYINKADTPASNECVLCMRSGREDAATANCRYCHRGMNCYVLMTLYPYNTGHLMIVHIITPPT